MSLWLTTSKYAGVLRFFVNVGVAASDAVGGDAEFAGGEFGMLRLYSAWVSCRIVWARIVMGICVSGSMAWKTTLGEDGPLSDQIVIARSAVRRVRALGGSGSEIHPHVAFQISGGGSEKLCPTSEGDVRGGSAGRFITEQYDVPRSQSQKVPVGGSLGDGYAAAQYQHAGAILRLRFPA